MTAALERLRAHIAEIIAEFQRLANLPPRAERYRDASQSDLGPLIDAVLQTAGCTGDCIGTRRVLVERAATHGERRRHVGFTAEELLEEHAIMRTAIWNVLTEDAAHRGDVRGAMADIAPIDEVISLASTASLMGYHRATIERHRDWPAVLRELGLR